LQVGTRESDGVAPMGPFNAAGLLIRSPASASGSESWVMYNLGFQNGFFAREAKTTARSLSTLYLNATSAHAGRLRVCRLGDVVRLYHWLDGETGWTQEAYDGSTLVMGDGPQPAPGVANGVIAFARDDTAASTSLPATLDVGLMAGSWGAPLDVRGEFDYLRFRPATGVGDCTAP
jgi:hypothetical protein